MVGRARFTAARGAAGLARLVGGGDPVRPIDRLAMTSLAGALSLGMGDEIVSAALFLALRVALAYRRTAETDPGSSSTPSGG